MNEENNGSFLQAVRVLFGHYKPVIIAVCAALIIGAACFLLGRFSAGKDVHDNTDAIRNATEQLDRAEDAQQSITESADRIDKSAGNIEAGIDKAQDGIGAAQTASEHIDAIIDECQEILDAVKKSGR